MSFYTYRQNNSYGTWDIDAARGISRMVVVEADSEHAANARAVAIGLYFDGIEAGVDCECCGDRWSNDPDGPFDKPCDVWGEPLKPFNPKTSYTYGDGCPAVFVHYKDGTVLAADEA